MEISQLLSSVTFRFVALLILIAVLAIPTAMVWGVIQLRTEYQDQVSHEISQGWGESQVFLGPVMRQTHREVQQTHEDSADLNVNESTHIFTPQSLKVTSKTTHEIRNKGIFSKPVYTTTYSLSGSFGTVRPTQVSSLQTESDTAPESCSIMVTLSDSQALRNIAMTYNGQSLVIKPTTQFTTWGGESVHAALSPNQCVAGDVEIELSLRGSNRQSIILTGDESQLTLESSWPHPKFEGRQLPDSHDIRETGFSAFWTSSELTRGFPSELSDEGWQLIDEDYAVGYALHEPITLYSMVERAVKYGFFIIGLTMLGIFCVELITTIRFHIVQYGVVGAGLTLFYLLLLSLAEHVGFIAAYLLAAGTLTTLITGYSWFSTRHVKLSTSICLLLIGIYAALYACLSSVDYALLIGSLLLVVLLVGLMYATRGLAVTQQLDSSSTL